MGDIADMLLDDIDRAFFDPDGLYYNDYYSGPQEVRCKHCGERHLHWQWTEVGWRLFTEQDDEHNCLSRASLPEEFPVVTSLEKTV